MEIDNLVRLERVFALGLFRYLSLSEQVVVEELFKKNVESSASAGSERLSLPRRGYSPPPPSYSFQHHFLRGHLSKNGRKFPWKNYFTARIILLEWYLSAQGNILSLLRKREEDEFWVRAEALSGGMQESSHGTIILPEERFCREEF